MSKEIPAIVTKSRVFGPGGSRRSLTDPRIHHESNRLPILRRPWIELDLGDEELLRQKYRSKGRSACIGMALVDDDLLSLEGVLIGDISRIRIEFLEAGMLTAKTRPHSATRLAWDYDGYANISPADENWVDRVMGRIAQADRLVQLKDFHLDPTRHRPTTARLEEPDPYFDLT